MPRFRALRWRTHPFAPALALAMASFLNQLDVTAVVVAMPSISGDLGFGTAGWAWVMDAYSLAFTGLLLASGALADRYGRRRALLLGNILFAAASLACGIAWNGPSLWTARAVQGMASAFVVTGAIALIAGAYRDPTDRARAFALTGIVSGVAMALGPTLGGIVASSFGWRWIFLTNVPICALIGWAVPRLVAETRDADGRSLDLPGILLLTVSLGIAIEALLAHDRARIWSWLGLLASAGSAAAFVVQQRHRPRPILDPALLAQPAMIGGAVLLFVLSVGYWAVLVYLPLFLHAAFGLSLEQGGFAMLAATLPMLVLPSVGGRLVSRWGWRYPFAAGLGIVAVGDLMLAGAMAVPEVAARFGVTLLGMGFIGTGAALTHSQLSGVVVALAPPAQAGMASALTVVMRQGGFAVGIAALGAALGPESALSGFPHVFALAAMAAGTGILAALMLLPKSMPRSP